MLDLKHIRENPEPVQRAIADKPVSLDLAALLAADKHVLGLTRVLQGLQEKRNQNAKLIPQASASERHDLISEGRRIGHEIAALKPAIEVAGSRYWAVLSNGLWTDAGESNESRGRLVLDARTG